MKPKPVMRTPRSYQLTRISALSALSVVGSFIHLPGPVQTVAFDSAPGFFAALLYGPLDGAAVCGLGHLATAIVNDAADGQQFFLDVAETTAWRLNYEVL